MYKVNPQRIQLGISACLMGQEVRFDGGHKRSTYVLHELKDMFDYLPICPEMAIGLGAPRKSVRLVRDQDTILLQSADGQLDITTPMNHYCDSKVAELSELGGYLFCAKSPTCGMERVTEYKIGTNNGTKTGVGVFARALMDAYPLMPVEETSRLNDSHIRDNFFTRVYAYHDWRCMLAKGLTKHELLQFHSRYKYLLMAHNQSIYRELGPLLATMENDVEAVAKQYFSGFMQALKCHATRKNQTSTLQHIQGYFKKQLNTSQKAELSDAIMQYRQGLVPLLVPITLINHYVREFSTEYIANQVYLHPHPQVLKLRYGL
ncbi:DUF523 and DUF1722 domain-containing protein [Shewanella sp. NIFS-20-20]|uniref:YbgA family protein n=1 Tax=Shewanella sp. NIFS-20-20 TaxID=2853806 RepID=UPI001C46978E|nr:DUF523 and DUF1722 domain-containing protein [Shewanella sp. NIFS-20-20]MBV7314505.1 DUF523 and DUF1722 domain-containing protein [Shewanella sp. NIFS-20-20]